jgi:hypothetical protein
VKYGFVRSSKIEESKPATAGPCSHVRNPEVASSWPPSFPGALLRTISGRSPEFLSQNFKGSTRRTPGISRACFHDIAHGSHLRRRQDQLRPSGRPTASAGEGPILAVSWGCSERSPGLTRREVNGPRNCAKVSTPIAHLGYFRQDFAVVMLLAAYGIQWLSGEQAGS